MKCYAGIVTFNPNLEKLKNNIRSIINQVDNVIICDNNSDNFLEILELKESISGEIEIIHNMDNRGIAGALNQLFEVAKERNVKYLLTLDQDSECPIKLVDSLEQYMRNDVAIVCPNFIDRNCKSYNQFIDCTEKVKEVKKCITSGSLNNVKYWEMVGGFDEKLFIDFVDFDFCFRLREMGFKILQVNDVTLLHELGESVVKNFLNKQIVISKHSNIRKYYMVRNYFYYRKKNNINDLAEKKAMRNKVLKMILFEQDKLKTIKVIYKGWKDSKVMF